MSKPRNYGEIVRALRPTFPKASKPALSAAMNTLDTGVQLCPLAAYIAAPWLGDSEEAPTKPRRKRRRTDKSNYDRWEVTLPKALSEALNAKMEELHFTRKQDFLEFILREVVNYRG